MTSRNEYLNPMLLKYSEARIEQRRMKESSEIAFENNRYEIVVTIPDTLDVREYFINISREKQEIYSDWNDIYKAKNESCLSKELDNLIQRSFRVVYKGKNSAKNDIIFD